MARYRIVTDKYAGFEAQYWRWWWPFWVRVGLSNTHDSIEKAEKYARNHASHKVVKNLGELP